MNGFGPPFPSRACFLLHAVPRRIRRKRDVGLQRPRHLEGTPDLIGGLTGTSGMTWSTMCRGARVVSEFWRAAHRRTRRRRRGPRGDGRSCVAAASAQRIRDPGELRTSDPRPGSVGPI